jgi:uncharacterized peroxidase-related enzyme
LALGDVTIKEVLEDWRSAPISDKLKAMLGYLEKLTTNPDEIGPEDVLPLRSAGIEDEAILEAIHVCVVFSLIARLADALDFKMPSAFANGRSAKMYLRLGYKLPIDTRIGS